MRVLFTNPGATLGGGERSLIDLAISYRAAEPFAEIHAVIGDDGPLVDALSGAGVAVRVVKMPRSLASFGDSALAENALAPLLLGAASVARRLPTYVARYKGAIDEIAPDVVHSNGLKTHLLAALVTRRPVVWHVRDFVGERRVVRRLLASVAGRARGAIAISRAVGQDIASWAPRLPVEIVPNAIDLDAFRPEGEVLDLDRAANVAPAPPGVVRVGLLATYARWKGHDVFFAALARLRRRQEAQAVRAYVIGGPVYATEGSQFSEVELRERARSFGIENQVGFVPFQAKPEQALRALDIVVHASSRPEPFGRTIVEAMACRRCVVVANAGGASELVCDGRDGRAVQPNDPTALAGVLAELVCDPTTRAQLAEEAHRTAARKFGRARLGPTVAALHGRLIRP